MAGKEKELVKIVGSENILNSAKVLEEYSKDLSFVPRVRPRYVVKPKNANETQRLVNWANENLTPLVPVSSGPPHFRGDTVPSTGGAVIVDLSGMKKIVNIDRLNRIAMIEPGVTFGELQPELEKAGLRANMPLLCRSSKSVIGSMLEREPVIMPRYQWDGADPLVCTEIIYGSGDEFRTGSASGPGSVEELRKAGVGFCDGMGPHQTDFVRFAQGAQGTMGIVTWATLRCEILPKLDEPFFVGSSELDSLFELVHWLLRLQIADECLVLNNSNLARYVTKQSPKKQWPKEYEDLRGSLPPWVLFFCISGYDYFPEEKIAYQTDDMTNIVGRLGLQPTKTLGGIPAAEMLRMIHRPSEEPYWKLRGKGACQDIFFLTTYDKCSELIMTMNNIANKYGYPLQDMGTYLQPVVQGTSCHCEFNLFYDASNPKELDRTQQLFADASKTLMDRGAYFSRPYGSWADMVYHRDAQTTIYLRKLKEIFDPNNIMNPGKLCF